MGATLPFAIESRIHHICMGSSIQCDPKLTPSASSLKRLIRVQNPFSGQSRASSNSIQQVPKSIATKAGAQPTLPSGKPPLADFSPIPFQPGQTSLKLHCPASKSCPHIISPWKPGGSIMAGYRKHSLCKALQGPTQKKENRKESAPTFASALAEQAFAQGK